MKSITRIFWGSTLLLLFSAFTGCQSLRELANLRNVDFAISGVQNARLAGVTLDRIDRPEAVTPTDLLRVTQAVARRELPLEFQLNLLAENPPGNPRARLVEMDWTLFLDDTPTISGVFDQNLLIEPGSVQGIPITIRLDLLEFFDRNARDLLDLALAVAGEEGHATRVMLRATPTIDTPIGPIRYPEPITIVSRDVGSP